MSFCIESSQASEKAEKKKKKKSNKESKESPSDLSVNDLTRIKAELSEPAAFGSPISLSSREQPLSSTPLGLPQSTKEKEKNEKKSKKRKHLPSSSSSSSSSDDDSSESGASAQDLFAKSPSKVRKHWKCNLRMTVPKTHRQLSHGELLDIVPPGEELIDDDTEVWMIQAPKKFNLSAVSGIKVDMSHAGSKKVTSDGNSYLVEWMPEKLPKSAVLPRSDSTGWRTVNQLSGSICIRQTVSMVQSEARPLLAYEPTFPSGLHQRYIPFGVTETASSPKKRKKKHKKQSPELSSESSQFHHSSLSENDLASPPKKKHKKAH